MNGNKMDMDKLVEEIQYQIPFKDKTEGGDTVLLLREGEDGQIGASYAKVLGFDLDQSKRDEWWHVRFVFLDVPPVLRTITLQTSHFTGQEVFTMGGRKVFIKAVNFAAFKEGEDIDPTPPSEEKKKPAFTLIK
ncbi:MAG: hypothetical protein ACRCTY_07205 [Candidatus Adiutrix sp.]